MPVHNSLSAIFIFFGILISYTYCRCGLEELRKKNLKKSTIDLWSNKKRFLQKETWSPLRIYIDYSTLESQSDLADQTFFENIKIVLDKVSYTYTNLLNVKAAPSNLKITECYTSYPLIISETVKNGVPADLVIFPYIESSFLESSTEAAATFCITDSVTNRPLAGFIAFNPKLSFSKINSLIYIELLLLHEFNHILSFNNDLYSSYIDNEGNKIPSDKVYANFTVNGEDRTMIITPKVMAAARKYYDCDSLVGVELENQGGPGSAMTHWEQRIMAGDFMISQSYGENTISSISLAFMEDSGWYKANYYTGGLFRFGKGRGCSFLNSKCVINGKTNFPNEYFLNSNEKVCFSGRSAKGISGVKNQEKIPKNYQYFSDPSLGGRLSADYCPIARETFVDNYFMATSCNYGISNLPSYFGEIIGPYSNCFISSLRPVNDTSLLDYKQSICYPVMCDSTSLSYNVTVGSMKLKCPSGGGIIYAKGFDGYLYCPNYNLICTASAPCSDAIDCVEKRSLELDPTKIQLSSQEFENPDSSGGFINLCHLFIVLILFIF
jgi:hypothetical protein